MHPKFILDQSKKDWNPLFKNFVNFKTPLTKKKSLLIIKKDTK